MLFKRYKGQILITIIVLLMILAMPFQDYIEREIGIDEITYSEGAFRTKEMYLKKGEYSVSFQIKPQKGIAEAEVQAPLYVNLDNTSGRTIERLPFVQNEGNVQIKFTVEDAFECVQFLVYGEPETEFHGIYLLSEPGIYRDIWIYAGLTVFVSAILLVYRLKKEINKEVLLLLGASALWACIPLGYTWIYEASGHDLYFHYGRLTALTESLSHNLFPVRMHTQMYRGYGYMTPVFYPELFLYPFAYMGLLGMSPIGCYKLFLITTNVVTAWISYGAFKGLLGSKRQGTIAAFLYTLSMYRLINLYTRAAMGEALAMIFLPLWMLGMYQLVLGDSRKWLVSVFAFTGLFQSHMITTELAVLFAVAFVICFAKKMFDKERIRHVLLAALSAILLNLWYLIPMLDHMRYSVYALHDVRWLSGYAVYPNQWFDVGMNAAAASAEGRHSVSQEMPYSLGIVLLLGCLLFIFACIYKKGKEAEREKGTVCFLFGILALYASSTWFPWDAVQRIDLLNKIVGNIQFAFRFLPIATLFLCVPATLGIDLFVEGKEQKQLLFVGCAVLTLVSSGTYFSNYMNQAQSFITKENQLDRLYETDANYLIDNNGEYFSKRRMLLQTSAFEAEEGIFLSECYKDRDTAGFVFEKTGDTVGYVDVSLNNYPYYVAYDEWGNRLETGRNEMLRLRVHLPETRTGKVSIQLELPRWYTLFDFISLGTLVWMLGSFVFRKYKYKH